MSAHGRRYDGTVETFVPEPVAFQERGREGGRNLEHQEDLAYSLNNPGAGGRRHEMNGAVPEPEVYQCHGNNVGEAGTLRAGNGGLTGGVPFVAEHPEPATFKASAYTRGKDGQLSPTVRPLSADADRGDQDPLVLSFDATWSGDYGVHEDQVGSLRDGHGTVPAVFRKATEPHNADEAERYEEDTVGNTLNTWDERREPPAHIVAAYGLRSDAGREGASRTPSADAEGRVRLRDPGFNVYEETSPTLDATAPHAVAFSCKDSGADAGDTSPTLRAMGHDGSHANAGGQVAVAFDWQAGHGKDDSFRGKSRIYPVRAGDYAGSLGAQKRDAVGLGMVVRRLTPVECERLQGIPDDWTNVPYKPRNKKTAEDAKDGPRYKALGNSFCVPVVRWIGERIALMEEIARERGL